MNPYGMVPSSGIAGYVPALIPVNAAGQPVVFSAPPPPGYFNAPPPGVDAFSQSSPFGPPPPMGGPGGGDMGSMLFMLLGALLSAALGGGAQGAAETGNPFDGLGQQNGVFPPPAWGGDDGIAAPWSPPDDAMGFALGGNGGEMDFGSLIGLLPSLFRSFGGSQSFDARRMPDGSVAFMGNQRRYARGPAGEVEVEQRVRGRVRPSGLREDFSSAERSRFFGTSPSSVSGSKQQAVIRTANRLGIDPVDLAAVMSFETGGTYNPKIIGGQDNKYQGLIQFGPTERRQYGYSPRQTFEEQVEGPVYRFLKDRGVKPGMGAKNIYAAILTGNARGNINARDSFGTSVSSALPQLTGNGKHRQNALRFLAKG